MGLFHRNNIQDKQSISKKPLMQNKALAFFEDEEIQCSSPVDEATIKMIYKALKEDNYDTADDVSLIDAISSLDANLYHLCKALIYQNFMLMRKIDSLSNCIDKVPNI